LDGEVFLSAGQKFAAGRFQEGLSIYPLPLDPYLVALLHHLIPNWVIAGRMKSRAGSWIAQQSDFQNMRIIFNDAVVAFHTGREINFHQDGPTQLYLEVDGKDFSEIEPVALKKNMDLLVLCTRRRAGNELPRFRQYAEIREFSGNDRVVTIYGLKWLFPDR